MIVSSHTHSHILTHTHTHTHTRTHTQTHTHTHTHTYTHTHTHSQSEASIQKEAVLSDEDPPYSAAGCAAVQHECKRKGKNRETWE